MSKVTKRVVAIEQANVRVSLTTQHMTIETLLEENQTTFVRVSVQPQHWDTLYTSEVKDILSAIEPDGPGLLCYAYLIKADGQTLRNQLSKYDSSVFSMTHRAKERVVPSPAIAPSPSPIVSGPVQPVQAGSPIVEDPKPSEGFVGAAMAVPSVPVPVPVMSQQEQQYREIAGHVLSGNRHNLYATQRVNMGTARTIDPELHVRRMREVIDACKEECVVLSYDIPDTVKDQCPNPSSWLWRYGFRFNLSVWMVPLKTINDEDSQVSQAIRHWQSHGVRVRWVRQHPDEAKKIQEYAIEDLRIQLVEWHTSLIRTIEGADTKLREELDKLPPESTERDELRLQQQRDSAIRKCLGKASDNLDSALKCAEIFDMTEDVDDLVRALRFARESALQSFNADAIRRGVKRAV